MRPTSKVTAAGLGGALAVLLCAVIPGEESPEVAAALATVVAFVCGWLMPDPNN